MTESDIGRAMPPSAATQRLAVAPRCAAMTSPRDGDRTPKPCQAPAMKGSAWCTNHRAKHDPEYVRPLPTAQARELAIQARAADLRISKEEEEKQRRRDAQRNRPRTKIIDKLAEELELAPRHVVDVLLEGLRATTTQRRRKLNPDGTQAAIARVWEDEESGKTKLELTPVYEDIEQPDWKQRLEFVREINDRLYGRPAQLKHVEGEVKHSGQVNVAHMLQAAKLLESDPERYYESLPDEAPPIDVGPGEVVASASPV